MNATFRFAVKACLLAAVSGALFNQAVGLLAQDGNTTPSNGTAAPKIKQTAGVQGGTAAAPQSAAPQGGASEVQKQLQELYRKNGREMPSMNIDELPNTQAPVPSTTAPVQVAPNGPVVAPSPAAVKPGRPNWFERTFRVGRGKKPPAAVAQQPTRPAVPGVQQPGMQQSQPRYATLQPAPRPAAPVYRAPVVTVTPAPQPPAQPQLREPTPIGIPGGVSDLAARPAAPEARSGQRNGISPPLMDESTAAEDSETLDLNQDDQPKFVNQAPQILPSQTGSRRAESPYTGLTISPNEMEQKIGSITKPFSPADVAREKESSTDTEPSNSALADVKEKTEPAPLSGGEDAARRVEKAAPLTAQAGKPAHDPGMMDDDDDEDDDDDDDKSLTLPVDESGKTAGKMAETGKSTAPANDKPALEETEKPTSERSAEKPAPIKGFRGFCPVAIKDERKLVEARPHIRSEYRGKIYTFSTVEAKETFEENPRKYIPAGDGTDVVRHAIGESGVEGTLEHAAWYRGRLYLFSSADTRREFVETPSKFMVND